MKRIYLYRLFLLSLVFIINTACAQDTLIKKNGERMIVDMMQISGDTLTFKLNEVITKMSNEDLVKIAYSGGNVTLFQTKAVQKIAPKPLIIQPFIDYPIEMYKEAYFQKGKPLNLKDVDKIIGSQNNRSIQLKYLSLKKSQNAKVFCASMAGLTIASTILYMALENRNGISQSKNANNNYFYGFGAGAAVFIALSYRNLTLEKMKRKELVYLYDDTYYPNQKK